MCRPARTESTNLVPTGIRAIFAAALLVCFAGSAFGQKRVDPRPEFPVKQIDAMIASAFEKDGIAR